MHFIIKKKLNKDEKFKRISLDDDLLQPNYIALSFNKNQPAVYSSNNISIFIVGDVVTDINVKCDYDLFYNAVNNNTVQLFGGFFYLIYFDSLTYNIKIYSSLLNILPIYYHINNNELIVTSSVELILNSSTKKFSVDKQYLLERVLFNYGLFNRTYVEGVKLVKTNYFIDIKDDAYKEVNQFEITDLFVNKPQKGKNILNDISDHFITNSQKYFPDEKYALSFTGGFDGRTLLALSKYYNKNYLTYSFGSSDSDDVLIPKKQAEVLDLSFNPFYLDENYIENESLKCGFELVNKTEGYASFARAHYLFAVEHLSNETNYMITGNFGSELFRAVHNTGVVISKELLTILTKKEDEWINELKSSDKLRYLEIANFNNEFEQLIQDIKGFKNNYLDLNLNQLLYVYVLK